jgi:tetratricopeptide (TPR) repeat protein
MTEVKKEQSKVVYFLDKISQICVLVGVLFVPLFFIPSATFPLLMGKATFISLFLFASLICFLAARLKSGQITFSRTHLYTLSAIILLITIASAFISGDFKNSFYGAAALAGTVLSIFTFLTILFLASELINTKGKIFASLLAFIFVFVLVSLYQTLRLFFGPSFLSFGVLNSVIDNLVGKWNDLAIFAGLGAILTLIALETGSIKGLLRFFFYGAFGLSLIILVFVNFDLAWIVSAAFALILTAYLFQTGYRIFGTPEEKVETGVDVSPANSESTPDQPARKIPFLSIILIILSLTFIVDRYAFPERPISAKVANTFQIFQIETRPSWSATFDIAKAAFKINPILGSGPNTFSRLWQKHKPAEVNETVFWSLDFVYGIGFLPTFWIATGILGFVFSVIFGIFFLLFGLKILFSKPNDRFNRFLSLALFSAACYGIVFMIFYVPSFSNIALTFFFVGLTIASLAGEGLIKKQTFSFSEKPKVGFAAVVVMIILLVMTITFAYFVTTKFAASWQLGRAVAGLNNDGDIGKAEARVKTSLKLSKSDAAYRVLAEINLIKLNQLISRQDALSSEEANNQFKDIFGAALDNAEAARRFDSRNFQNYLQLGRVYESVVPLKIPGAYDNAFRVYTEAAALNPTNPEIDLILARLESANGSFTKAKEHIAVARQKKKNYLEAVFFESQIEAARGNIAEAIKAAEAGALIAPNDPVIHFQLGVLRYNNRDYRGAVETLSRAVNLNPVYANARYFLGLSLEKLGEKDRAIAEFQEIKKNNPDNTELDVIIKNIKNGRPPFTDIPQANPANRNTLPVGEGNPAFQE